LDKSFEGLFGIGNDEQESDEVSGRSSVSNFMRDFGWIYQASLVAEFERVTMEEAYELSTIQFLNDLSYIKAKNEYESEQLKKAYGKKH